MPAGQRIDVKRDEESLQQVIRQHGVQRFDLQAEDIVEVVEVVQMLRHEILEPVQALVAAKNSRTR